MTGFLGLGATLAFLDIAVKNQIEAMENGEFPRDLEGTGGLVRLHKNHNPGFSFGVLKSRPDLVGAIPLCMLSAMAGAWAWTLGKRGRYLEKTAMTLILAGGASNVYDRKRRGYVVDYFSIRWKALKKVVFNLGDMFIFLGSALLVVSELAELLKKE